MKSIPNLGVKSTFVGGGGQPTLLHHDLRQFVYWGLLVSSSVLPLSPRSSRIRQYILQIVVSTVVFHRIIIIWIYYRPYSWLARPSMGRIDVQQ